MLFKWISCAQTLPKKADYSSNLGGGKVPSKMYPMYLLHAEKQRFPTYSKVLYILQNMITGK